MAECVLWEHEVVGSKPTALTSINGGIGIRSGLKPRKLQVRVLLDAPNLPRWLVEIGTPNGLRNRAFLGSSPSLGTRFFRKHAPKVGKRS
ncbi:MAG: hypothetical protein [Caudoviricetes sp.]|nr:MAG: hypothetical protein [Caudoviricetes sp.]